MSCSRGRSLKLFNWRLGINLILTFQTFDLIGRFGRRSGWSYTWFDRCSIFDFQCSIFDIQFSMFNFQCSMFNLTNPVELIWCSLAGHLNGCLVHTVGFIRSGSVQSMFNTINIQYNQCLMQLMFNAINVRSSVRLVNEEAQDTCKCGRSSDFLNEDCLIWYSRQCEPGS